MLHVPSIGLVVAGDVAYNGVHQYLLESAHGGVEAWLAALDKVAALQPRAVVAGHKNKDLPDDPAIIDQTRDYLLNARRLLAEKLSPREYFDEMIALYPDRLNVGPVWYTAVALLPEPTAATSSVRDEVTHWFFDDYLTTWIGVGAGTIAARARVHPRLLGCATALERRPGQPVVPGRAGRGGAACEQLQTRLRDDGYAHTAVPDHRVTVYHDNGAAIEVIWSRRRADGTEIERAGRAFRGGARAGRMAHHRHSGRHPQPATHSNTVWPQAN